jgi:folate-dependent phosphoribosylglycinamide formyltransferase PurN
MTPREKRVVVLAEPESLFLPHCVARLAQLHPLVAVIEAPTPPLKLGVRRAWTTFGPRTTAAVAAAEAAARLADRVSSNRFYSLRKVARRLGIPYEKVSDLHGADCAEAIARHRPDVVFTQVSRLVRPELLRQATFWNKHCALLPAYGGVFPVFWALLRGEDELGVTIHEMDEEFDRGPILQQASVSAAGHTFFSAYHALHDETPELLDRALRGDVVGERPERDRSYFGFPTAADRRRFLARRNRFGRPFRLHPPVRLKPQPPTAASARTSSGLPSSVS